jgi:hypothetical protein
MGFWDSQPSPSSMGRIAFLRITCHSCLAIEETEMTPIPHRHEGLDSWNSSNPLGEVTVTSTSRLPANDLTNPTLDS